MARVSARTVARLRWAGVATIMIGLGLMTLAHRASYLQGYIRSNGIETNATVRSVTRTELEAYSVYTGKREETYMLKLAWVDDWGRSRTADVTLRDTFAGVLKSKSGAMPETVRIVYLSLPEGLVYRTPIVLDDHGWSDFVEADEGMFLLGLSLLVGGCLFAVIWRLFLRRYASQA